MFEGDAEDKNKELIKLLEAIGIDPNEAMSDPNMQKKLVDIVTNFDPNKKFSAEDQAFAV